MSDALIEHERERKIARIDDLNDAVQPYVEYVRNYPYASSAARAKVAERTLLHIIELLEHP